ncbi:MAG: AAA family ATPase [Algoriphagus sp. 32-45-6]|nr:MAG: AAA family ATPase [Algoriphagus sp. 32-45-6]
MDVLFEKFQKKLSFISLGFKRSLLDQINWNARLIGIKGARGVGKTTLMLQYIKENLPLDQSTLYVSLDNIWFAENKLADLVDLFVKRGGRFLFLDEVHKYPNWSQEIKNIYDDYPELKVVFTGSSLLEILNARADLSRRSVIYTLQGLSFREYLGLIGQGDFKSLSFQDILTNHIALAKEISARIKPLVFFDQYLRFGYFPFFQEEQDLYYHRLGEVINMTLEVELPLLRKVEISYVQKLKQLLQIISESAPFTPNVSKLAERIGVNRNTFATYLNFLQEANLTKNLYKDASGITALQKPDKIYLENTNFQFALAPQTANQGSVRETFVANQLSYLHQIEYADQGDFKVNGKVVFEVGGKNKKQRQIENLNDSYILSDDIEIGFGNRIPIWLIGFLY